MDNKLYSIVTNPGEKCPIFKNIVPKKSVTVICNIEDAPEVKKQLAAEYGTTVNRYHTDNNRMVYMQPCFR